MGRIKRSLVHKMLRAVDVGVFEQPKAWPVLTRYRTAELFLKHPAPPAVAYQDQHLHRQLVKAYPEVKLEPLRVNAIQPSLATRFIDQQRQALLPIMQQQPQQQQQELPQWQQMEAIEPAAFKEVEAKMRSELLAARHETTSGGYLEYIQQQEEEALQAALGKLSDQQAAVI